MPSRKNLQRGISSILIIVFVSLSFSCPGDGLVWGQEPQALMQAFREGKTGFLADLDLSEYSLQEARLLGDGAGYYLSFHFEQAGRPEAAVAALRWTADTSHGIWKHQAYSRLIELCLDTGAYEEAEAAARAAVAEFPDEYEFRRTLIEALYWLQESTEVLRLAEELDGTAGDPEVHLFRAVSTARAGGDGWKDSVVEFFAGHRAGELHVRFFDFLRIQGLWPDGFEPSVAAYLRWKDLLGRGELRLARSALDELLSMPAIRFSASDIVDLVETFHRSGGDRAGAAIFADEPVLSRMDAPAWVLLQERARLLRYAGLYPEAADAFEKAIPAAPLAERQRLLWYAVNVRIKYLPLSEALNLPGTAEYIRDPEYFADIFEEVVTDLVGRSDWESIRRLLSRDSLWLTTWEKQRCAYILLRISSMGLTAPEGLEKIAEDAFSSGGSYAGETGTPMGMPAGDGAYYSILYDTLRGYPPVLPVDSCVGPEAAVGIMNEEDVFIRDFLDFGLYEEAYSRSRTMGRSISVSTVRAVCTALQEHGMFLESLRLAEALLPGDMGDDIPGLFPLPFRNEIEDVCRTYQLDEHIFRALVREESFYESGIVSHAGAVGLTQLMPDTASDVASRLKIDEPDLTHPETNLRLGAYYFRNMIDRTGEIGLALASYNAGITRVRRWKNEYSRLPGDIFIEAIPYLETRGYVRRVFTAAAAYGVLSGESGYLETAQAFFPGFLPDSAETP